MQEKPLTGKVAIVTGAASPIGLGRAMTEALVGAGARVAMLDINQDWLKVKRIEYRIASIPTVLRNIPKNTSIAAAKECPRCAMMTSTTPSSAAIRMSREPKYGATAAIEGARRIRQITEKMPPKKDALYASDNARRLCPWRVREYPS